MKVKDFLSLPLLIEQDEDGVWVAESPIFDGFYTQGYDLQELESNLQDLSNMYFQMIKDGEKPFKSSKLIQITYDKHGKITNNISKELDKDIEEKMIQIN